MKLYPSKRKHYGNIRKNDDKEYKTDNKHLPYFQALNICS